MESNLAEIGLVVMGERVGPKEGKAPTEAVPNTFLTPVSTTENLAKARVIEG